MCSIIGKMWENWMLEFPLDSEKRTQWHTILESISQHLKHLGAKSAAGHFQAASELCKNDWNSPPLSEILKGRAISQEFQESKRTSELRLYYLDSRGHSEECLNLARHVGDHLWTCKILLKKNEIESVVKEALVHVETQKDLL